MDASIDLLGSECHQNQFALYLGQTFSSRHDTLAICETSIIHPNDIQSEASSALATLHLRSCDFSSFFLDNYLVN